MINPEEIYNLILLKQEGGYWDFKRQWYESGHEGDLLHDIICMSNNLDNRDAYIIIGVDEEDDYKPYDVTHDPNKRTTQMIVSFLQNKRFAGDVRPVVTVETVHIRQYCLDVVVVHNSTNTPFYLNERYKQVRENSIYTRIQDTNTPVDKSADITHVEYLWKKRLGLVISPLERIHYLLKDKENWIKCPRYEETLQYYKFAPEFTIGYPLEDPAGRNGYEVFILNQCDNKPWWTIIQLKYHQTVLDEIEGVILDGGRHMSPCPLLDGVSTSGYGSWDVSYDFFVKDELPFAIHEFYLDTKSGEALTSDRRFMENILLFETEEEHQLFNYFLENNWWRRDSYLNDIRDPYVPDLEGYNTDVFKERIINNQIMQKMLKEFRLINNQ